MVRPLAASAGAAALALLLAWRLVDGSARNLVQGWYVPVLWVTAALLLAAAAAALPGALRGGDRRLLPSAAGALAALLVALPLVLGAVYRPRPLSSSNLDLAAASARQFGAPASAADPASRNIYQWAYEFENASAAEIAGLPVDVVGFVYRAAEDPPDRFRVARFVVACCIADAKGFALPVAWRAAATLPPDQWVRVTGRIGIAPDGSPLILAASVEPIEVPRNPYIYP